ncbi:MAG: efflux RND transporter periplasmic adaptor subunit [Chlamydiota bacterium]|nr:efflux RND transporter periplasmic adaptor subunit [Chlamydiota bacterium]
MKLPNNVSIKSISIALLITSVFLIILILYLFSEKQTQEKMDHSVHSNMQMSDSKNIYLSERASKLAQVEVAPVIREFIPFEIRLYGSVDYDETKLAHITAWVPGRIEKLYINFTGMAVEKSDPMVDYYSPNLIVAQEELIQSLKSFRELKNTQTSFAKDQSGRNLESARIKLRLLGIDPEQIEEIEATEKVKEVIRVKAPASGVVIHKNALEGEYVKEGTEMFTIAELDEVWIQLEAYESDLPGLKLNEKVQFKTDAYPGEIFTGRISFIDPFLNEKTRTTSFRLNVENKEGKLKPGMYVTGVVNAYITAEGETICHAPIEQTPPLVIPASAALITGKRAIVYVQNQENPFEYSLREVVLGPRVGNHYIVNDGLDEGELIVVHGNFKIDSAAQIQAKPSMMSPEGGVKPMKGHGH